MKTVSQNPAPFSSIGEALAFVLSGERSFDVLVLVGALSRLALVLARVRTVLPFGDATRREMEAIEGRAVEVIGALCSSGRVTASGAGVTAEHVRRVLHALIHMEHVADQQAGDPPTPGEWSELGLLALAADMAEDVANVANGVDLGRGQTADLERGQS